MNPGETTISEETFWDIPQNHSPTIRGNNNRCAIFEAASFESYFIQELRGLLDSFREKKDTWTGVVRNEWKRANPTLVSQLPEELHPQEFDMEVSDYLRQLGVALKRDRPFND